MTNHVPAVHAIIPAAGRSRRMGRPKLLLEINGVTIIERLIRQLQAVSISSISVLAREDDQSLQEIVTLCGADIVIPKKAPQQMRESVEILLSHLTARLKQDSTFGWLLIPADHPVVLTSVLDTLLTQWRENPQTITVPVYRKRRGHPTVFPGAAADAIDRIPQEYGLNWLLKSRKFPIREVDLDEPSVLWDVDTPEDFERIRRIFADSLKIETHPD